MYYFGQSHDEAGELALAPLHGSKVIVAEQRVENTEGGSRLRPFAEGRVSGIAPVPEVLDCDRVLLVNAHRKRHVSAGNVVVTAAAEVVRSDVAHEVFAQAQVQRRSVAENGTQLQERLGRDPIVIV